VSGVLRVSTPAKLNLGLALVGMRADGYHLLESVFAPIALYDEIELAVEPGAAGISLVCGPPLDPELPEALHRVPSGPENLVHRAAQLFCDRTGYRARVSIRLRKGIPAGAGLGGGSSDAAAVLCGLRDLSGLGSSPDELARFALELGADVPFFLAPRPALVTGIGERIEPLKGLPELEVVLVNPGKTLATADVYRMADQLGVALTKHSPGSTMRALSGLTRENRDAAPALRDVLINDLLVNDLEPAARRLCPSLARIADRLDRLGARAVSMTGSGATVFGVFETEQSAREAVNRWHADDERQPGESSDGRSDGEGEPEARCWVRATRVLASN
jgi:4-diphosphocytidyl-2-C-methyl-D-erythritol kinase